MTTSVASLRGQRVYLDTNVLIYFLDGTPNRVQHSNRVFRAAADGLFQAVTGDAAIAEVMVAPYRSGDPLVIRSVREFLRQPRLLDVVGHSADMFEGAAMIRATKELSFVDALHLATAAEARCSALITDDKRMRSALGVEIVPLRSLTD